MAFSTREHSVPTGVQFVNPASEYVAAGVPKSSASAKQAATMGQVVLHGHRLLFGRISAANAHSASVNDEIVHILDASF
ncbi:hypothetical protein Bresa_01011|nr:hypothetical protein [Brenneria salicis ATCC 15712 = DSM 30166]RLM28687.1 hypothetical protein BHG07_16835 [Brenneria salicis ATCC 15712 = DSM 30166]